MNRIKRRNEQILGVILAIASLLCTFGNWIVTARETEYEWNRYTNKLQNVISSLELYASWGNSLVNTDSLERTLINVSDGKLSPPELFNISRTAAHTLSQAERADILDDATLRQVHAYHTLFTLYEVFFVLLIGSWIISMAARIIGKVKTRSLDSWFFLFQIIHAVIYLTLMILAIDHDLTVHITLLPVLACILAYPCAYPSTWLARLPLERINPVKSSNPELISASVTAKHSSPRSDIASWWCPSCAAVNLSDQNYCPKCGMRRPIKNECPGCGLPIAENDQFCKHCGCKL